MYVGMNPDRTGLLTQSEASTGGLGLQLPHQRGLQYTFLCLNKFCPRARDGLVIE